MKAQIILPNLSGKCWSGDNETSALSLFQYTLHYQAFTGLDDTGLAKQIDSRDLSDRR